MSSPKRLVRPDSQPRAKVVPLRLPADLVAALDDFARSAEPELTSSGAMRMLMRAGLAAHKNAPFDLRGAAHAEGYAAGHGQAVEMHQRALHAAKETLGPRAA